MADFWEEKYASGHQQRYPWDAVVSFVFRNAPREKARKDVRIVEVGCGTASNLWFAAREGFQVAGVDASPSAIRAAQARFAAEGLQGDLRVADFARLPFADASFDLAVDRAALTCAGYDAARVALAELRRVLRPGGRLYFNPYSDKHTSATAGERHADGTVHGIRAGTLVGAGQLCFYSHAQLLAALGPGWRVLSAQELVQTDRADPALACHAEWRVVAEKA
jgi:SAM-dependent methyltransferase